MSGAAGFISPANFESAGGPPQTAAGRPKITAKALRRMLKKAGLKTTGKKAALTRRAKKAHLKMRGGADGDDCDVVKGSGKQDGTVQGDKCIPKTPATTAAAAGTRRRRRNGLIQGVYRGTTGIAKGSLRSFGKIGRDIFGKGGKARKGGQE